MNLYVNILRVDASQNRDRRNSCDNNNTKPPHFDHRPLSNRRRGLADLYTFSFVRRATRDGKRLLISVRKERRFHSVPWAGPFSESPSKSIITQCTMLSRGREDNIKGWRRRFKFAINVQRIAGGWCTGNRLCRACSRACSTRTAALFVLGLASPRFA